MGQAMKSYKARGVVLSTVKYGDSGMVVQMLTDKFGRQSYMVQGVTGLLITLLLGGYLAIDGTINVGQFIAFNSYIGMLVWPMMAVGECITSISQGMASARRIFRIFCEKPEIVDGEKLQDGWTQLKDDGKTHEAQFPWRRN